MLPTPAVAYLTGALGADLGVMLSASHNPMPDNGIKFFARGGHKLADDDRGRDRGAHCARPWERPTGAGVGRVRDDADALASSYVDHLIATAPHRLDGLKVVVDGANGAASASRPRRSRGPGAEVITIGAEPDGLNINDGCGSTHLERCRPRSSSTAPTLGIAHDGDADRCLAVDAAGAVVDGDQILAVLALAMREAGHAASTTPWSSTVMSNLGFKLAMTRGRHRRRRDGGRRPLCAGGDARRRLRRSAASSPGT